MRGKGGKAFKRTTSKGRKIKRLREHFRWPDFDADRLNQELPATRRQIRESA